jgi:DNA ligase 1
MVSMRFEDVAHVSADVAATASRTEKISRIAAGLADADPSEAALAAAWLSGTMRQGRMGVGWAILERVHVDPAATASLSVVDVDSCLDGLADATGDGSTARRSEILESLLARCTSGEADFMRRLLLGEMRQGALQSLVADALAVANGIPRASIRRALMLSGDIGEVAATAKAGGADGLAGITLDVLRPVLPMLATTTDDVGTGVSAFAEASVEWKLDGARVQVHRSGKEVRVFTRNLNDVTGRLPEVVSVVRSFDAQSFVLDGEVLGLDIDASPRDFQDTMSRFGAGDRGGRITLQPFFFDVLALDETLLIDEPLRVRQVALDSVVGERAVPRLVTSDPAAGAEFARAALAAGHEGVMVKDRASLYSAGRRGKTWLKVKPVHSLDLVVLAVEWGHGRRAGLLSNLHLGARDGDRFVMVGKTFKGLTDETLRWQTDHFRASAKHDDGRVVHVEPSTVVEIAVDGVQRSTRYPGGVALRFARVRGYRPDRSAHTADTIDAVRALGSTGAGAPSS